MTGASYTAAGVDVEAGEHAVALMRAAITKTSRSEVVGDFGGFAGLFDISAARGMTKPLLATSTDGVGTKIDVARRMDKHDTVGIDLVAMVVDDLVVCGAEPLFMTDYIAVGKVHPQRVADIVRGIAQGCVQAGCALVGGETAEHPGLLAEDEYDIAGAGTGIVDEPRMLSAKRVQNGDAVIALSSSGLHSNGYSLARHVAFDLSKTSITDHISDFGRTLGEEFLEPTRIYAQDVLAAHQARDIHSASHITGGGIAANLARVLPEWAAVDLDRSTWSLQPIFKWLVHAGEVELLEAERTFNMGIGMALVVNVSDADEIVRLLSQRGVNAWTAGTVRERDDNEVGDAPAKGGAGGAVTLVGSYR